MSSTVESTQRGWTFLAQEELLSLGQLRVKLFTFKWRGEEGGQRDGLGVSNLPMRAYLRFVPVGSQILNCSILPGTQDDTLSYVALTYLEASASKKLSTPSKRKSRKDKVKVSPS